MQRKIKSVLRSTRRKKSPSSRSPRQSYESSDAASPRSEHFASPPTSRGRGLSDASKGASPSGPRSRPVSAAYDDRRMSNVSAPHYPTESQTQSGPLGTTGGSHNGSIANDYKAYLPALSPVDDLPGGEYMTLGGDRRLITGESDGRHEEDVADRNIDRYGSSYDAGRDKPLPAAPGNYKTTDGLDHKYSVGSGSLGSATNSVPSGTTPKYVVGRDIQTNGGLVDSILPHHEQSGESSKLRSRDDATPYIARDESRVAEATGNPRGFGSDKRTSQSRREDPVDRQDIAAQSSKGPAVTHSTSTDGRRQQVGTQDWKSQQASLLDGVVDLRNTVDTDKDVQVAAPVVHETVRREQRELIQQKIYREIHNYTHYHRLQPVMHTEVLPPRHFIPNPHGEGLIEISADELPGRTGQNRWWEIVQKEIPQTFEIQSRWRTEPEVIHGEPYMTAEGFERKETTIIYPPTLEDMSEYDGVVQPVHFDHKTGDRWLGEITTMAKLKEQHDQDALTMRELTESLPEVPDSPTVKRKPVGL